MKHSTWNIVISCLFLTTVISRTMSEQIETRVFRFAGKDVFKNPEYSSYTECGVDSCTKYQAQCLEDGNCCLCRCNFKFSTFNVSETKCLADKTILAASAFRFRRGDYLHTGIPTITLSRPKTLGQIVKFKENVVLRNCKVLKKASHYWSDGLGEGWKSLLGMSDDKLLELRNRRNEVTLEWVYNNSTRDSWFHGRVFRIGIQCTGTTSTVIFKSRKNYNKDDFIGCFKPDNETTSLPKTFNCGAMTPTMCKRFCQAHGYSVAMLKQGTQCFCSEYSQVMLLDEARFSCSIPCGGNGETFCGGKETYSTYRTMPEWPIDFQFSSNGSLNSMKYRCAQINRPNPSTLWNNTYLCAKRIGANPRLRWFSRRPHKHRTANRRCIAINQTSNSSSWKDNFLCVPKEVGLFFTWSYFGHPDGTKCLKMEAEQSLGWENNYLCTEHTKDNQTMVSALCPSKGPGYPTVAASTLSSMSRTEQKTRTNDTLPRLPEHSVPSLSTVPNSGSKQDSNDETEKDLELIPLYVFVTFASILCVLVFGFVALLYLKRKIKSTQYLNAQARLTSYDNAVCQNDKTGGKQDQKNGRKSRKERLPSLPALTEETQSPQSPNAAHESIVVPPKTQPENHYYITPEPTSRHLVAKGTRASTMENGVYNEIPVGSNIDPVNRSELGDQRNNVGRERANSNNPTYESIDNCLNPETVYLEVLP